MTVGGYLGWMVLTGASAVVPFLRPEWNWGTYGWGTIMAGVTTYLGVTLAANWKNIMAYTRGEARDVQSPHPNR
ncbi:MAG: hypothetical protein IT371_05305 [Deltaproteobacteria bacterium]|nr:hypothetical protein [Deltaproteobacteria bacterium]